MASPRRRRRHAVCASMASPRRRRRPGATHTTPWSRSQNARRHIVCRALRPLPLPSLVHPGARVRNAHTARLGKPLGLRRLVALVDNALGRRRVGVVLVVLPVGIVVGPPFVVAAFEPIQFVARVGRRPPWYWGPRPRVGRARRVGARAAATPRAAPRARARAPPRRARGAPKHGADGVVTAGRPRARTSRARPAPSARP